MQDYNSIRPAVMVNTQTHTERQDSIRYELSQNRQFRFRFRFSLLNL